MFSRCMTCVGWTIGSGFISTASAHPGHGVTQAAPHSVLHYTFEPVHGVWLTLAMLLVLSVGWFWSLRRSEKKVATRAVRRK
ncbi:MAG: hypothetical protein ACKN9U_11740 [Pirellulaceae bacterium]